MEKVLIVSYFFPPGNFAGSYRINSWANYFHHFGYFPIILTRHWDENETDYTAISRKTELEVEENDYFRIIRHPYKGTLRDRFVSKVGKKGKVIGKVFTLFQLISQNFLLKSIPYSNLYSSAKKILEENPDIRILIISGNPFHQFRFGYLLKKSFPDLKWVADYRDEWNSYYQHSKRHDFLWKRVLIWFESAFEKKWLKRADLITSVSKLWLDQIVDFIHYKGSTGVILNGFDPADFNNHNWQKPPSKKRFILLYSGTLYPFQNFEVISRGIKLFLTEFPGDAAIEVVFAGLNKNRRTHKKIIALFNGYERFVKILPRMPKPDFLNLLHASSVFLMFPYSSVPGCYSSKVFEFLPTGRPIILAPSDNDLIAELIEKTRTGLVTNDENEVCSFLKNQYDSFLIGKHDLKQPSPMVWDYSRKKQTEILSDLLSLLLKNKS